MSYFSLANLAGTPPLRELALETRQKNPITNSQSPHPDVKARNEYYVLRAKHPQWTPRKDPEGIYNCFGHVLASRRTAVYPDDADIEAILVDDGYQN